MEEERSHAFCANNQKSGSPRVRVAFSIRSKVALSQWDSTSIYNQEALLNLGFYVHQIGIRQKAEFSALLPSSQRIVRWCLHEKSHTATTHFAMRLRMFYMTLIRALIPNQVSPSALLQLHLFT